VDQQIKDYILIGGVIAFALYMAWNRVKLAFAFCIRAVDAMERLADELAQANSLDAKPLLEGLVRVCAAQVEAVQKPREAVASFTKLVAREPEKDEDVVQNYSEEDADRAFARGQYMAEGYSPEEADLRVDVDDQRRIYSGTPGL
jgi:hypothetical protein